MEDKKIFKLEDLVLKVNPIYDPNKLNLDDWENFINRLCGDREYQKDAIRTSIIYLAGGKYTSILQLANENFNNNNEIRRKFDDSCSKMNESLQLQDKLYATIDLATGTGKSYVLYGIAQIMLGLGLVDKVLLLCPSLTIESGLTQKFNELSGNSNIKESLPDNAIYKNPGIVDANVTIKNGDICIENIHSVYNTTGSSIKNSFQFCGSKTLVLNDEAHHIFNKSTGKGTETSDFKKWKELLLDKQYNFKYIIGTTGTAYIEDEYFTNVIYRYSLKDAMDDKIIKEIKYIDKGGDVRREIKFQEIYQNHRDNKDMYPRVKPLTILITKDILNAKQLLNELEGFLAKKENKSIEEISKKTLIVTSSNDHKDNIVKLKQVDDKENPIEWIVSVSMLTEGWDVKNVFQIVPWEDRAFNSKLLIAQVLGRGLRIPEEYSTPQPKVIVFNHDSWSKNIKGLVEEILENEVRINSQIIKDTDRSKFNFKVYNIDYGKIEKEINHKIKKEMDFSRIEKEGIGLISQSLETENEITYIRMGDSVLEDKKYLIENESYDIEEIIDKLYEEFEMRDWEGKTLKLGKDKYTQNELPPRHIIKNIILKSMSGVGIKGNKLIERNRNSILHSFNTLLRTKSKTVVSTTFEKEIYEIPTINMGKESLGIGNFRKESTIYYTTNYLNEVDDEQAKLIKLLDADQSLPRHSVKEINEYCFKTPLSVILTGCFPEREFVKLLCKQENAALVNSWIKSRDTGFYSIDYTWRKNNHQKSNNLFNPDFFIEVKNENGSKIIVVETKADNDICEENKAKYKYAKDHFRKLNKKMKENNIDQTYIFHFLSPNGYNDFFEYLRNDKLESFKCELERLLEEE